jgi:hypothetical protein
MPQDVPWNLLGVAEPVEVLKPRAITTASFSVLALGIVITVFLNKPWRMRWCGYGTAINLIDGRWTLDQRLLVE